jgi:transglutaminase-like putative cysteine protease
VEVLVSDGAAARAIAFDPSNGSRAGPRPLPVAVGRDYADVAPTSGWYRGRARGALTCEKRAGVSAVAAVA